MTTKNQEPDTDDPRPVRRRKPRSKVLPKDYNWLSVPVPSQVHNHVHIQARQSNMSLKGHHPMVPDGSPPERRNPGIGLLARPAVCHRIQDEYEGVRGHLLSESKGNRNPNQKQRGI